MLEPVTLTWPNGSTATLTRTGERVQATLTIHDGATSETQPLPAGLRPYNSPSTIQATVDTALVLIVRAHDATDSSEIMLMNMSGATVSGVVAWLGEEIDGSRSLCERLREYVEPGATVSTVDESYLRECLLEAFDLVESATTSAAVPDSVRERAILECASELWNRRQAPSGITQYADPLGQPVRLARDPMTGARTLLAPYLPLGFA